jgi:hypothetical protein
VYKADKSASWVSCAVGLPAVSRVYKADEYQPSAVGYFCFESPFCSVMTENMGFLPINNRSTRQLKN